MKIRFLGFAILSLALLTFSSCLQNEIEVPIPQTEQLEKSSTLMQLIEKNKSESLPDFKFSEPDNNNLTTQGADFAGTATCGCTFSIVSSTLVNSPENSYWASGIYYVDGNGNNVGPIAIGNAGFFPTSHSFTTTTGTNFTVETAYSSGSTDPGGTVKVRVACHLAPSVKYTFVIPSGIGQYEEQESGATTNNCGTVKLSAD